MFSDEDQLSWWNSKKRGLSGLTHRAIPGREDLNSIGFSPRTQMYWKRSFLLLIDSHSHFCFYSGSKPWNADVSKQGLRFFFSYAKTTTCLFFYFCCCIRIVWTEPSAKVYAEPSLHQEVHLYPYIKLPYVLKDKIPWILLYRLKYCANCSVFIP